MFPHALQCHSFFLNHRSGLWLKEAGIRGLEPKGPEVPERVGAEVSEAMVPIQRGRPFSEALGNVNNRQLDGAFGLQGLKS